MEAGTLFCKDGGEIVSRVPEKWVTQFAMNGGASGELREWDNRARPGVWNSGEDCSMGPSRAPIIMPEGQASMALNAPGVPVEQIKQMSRARYAVQWRK